MSRTDSSGQDGWTRHGHRIEGMVQIGRPKAVARCGGPALCHKCALDTASAIRPATPTEETADLTGPEQMAARALAEETAEVDDLRWAEMLTHQECAAKKHPDWFIDSEHNLTCPWCTIDDLRARLAKVEALVAPGWRTNRGHEYDTLSEGFAAGRNEVIDEIRAALANPDAAGEGK